MRADQRDNLYKSTAVRRTMTNAIVTVQIVPEAPDTDVQHIVKAAESIIDKHVGKHMQKHIDIQPFVFGLKKIEIQFMISEDKGSPDGIAEEIAEVEGVKGSEITNVTRALG
jgi:translation elongation factor aEF-1 beta